MFDKKRWNEFIQVDEKKLVKARKEFYDHATYHAPTVDRLIFISIQKRIASNIADIHKYSKENRIQYADIHKYSKENRIQYCLYS